MTDNVKQRQMNWLWALLWVGVIYMTLYIVRPICTFLKANTPFVALSNIGMALVLGSVVYCIVYVVKLREKLSYILLLVLLGLYVYGISMIRFPEEKLHFVEYGVLSFLLFRALRCDFSEIKSYLGAAILTACFGWVDEGIQHVLPNRHYSNEDVALNAISGLLGLGFVFISRREKRF